MRPELFRLLDVGFPSYFVLLLSGFLFATALGVLWAKRIGLNPDVVVDLGLAMLLAGVAGSRILHVLVDGYFWDYVHLCTDPGKVDWPLDRAECVSTVYDGVWDAARGVCHPKKSDCLAWAKFWAGGLTYYGGFFGAADMAGFAVPMGLAFGRMGCLLAGCCFGAPTELPWGLSFPPRSPASEEQAKTHMLESVRMWSHPVHPTQIYESAASLGIAAFLLLWLLPRKRYDGQIFVGFLVLYALARFLVEILRRDARGGFLGLSTSQLIGLGLVGTAVLVHRLRAPRPA
jgi:phosphatidylglycerol---prolipoprotein diacylglyceryl transferase